MLSQECPIHPEHKPTPENYGTQNMQYDHIKLQATRHMQADDYLTLSSHKGTHRTVHLTSQLDGVRYSFTFRLLTVPATLTY